MQGKERREAIEKYIYELKEAVTGSNLAKKFNVSRQVIVQDIALLRAQGAKIISTPEGYLPYKIKSNKIKKAFLVKHEKSEIEDELNTIVDYGGNILNVHVMHPSYGEIVADINVSSRRDVAKFIKKLEDNEFVPLMNLTGGKHCHIVEADSEEIINDIEKELINKGYLID